MWPSYKGGSWSRAGTPYVGYSKQTGQNYPPRMITFQFSLTQGLALEFGHRYMRVAFDGGQVTESPFAIITATRSDPCVITVSTLGVATATANNAGTVVSYAPGDQITVAGGSYTVPAVLGVGTTLAVSLRGLGNGTGYVPGEVITMAGGTFTTAAQGTLVATAVSGATINAAGAGGVNGAQIATGTDGTGTKFQVNVTVAGGAVTAIGSFITRGSYTVNPTLAAQPVTVTGGVAGATLNLTMGPDITTVTTAGSYTVNPTNSTFTQGATSGVGVGGTFFAVMGVATLTVPTPGTYITIPTNPVSQASTTGHGAGAVYTLTWGTGAAAFNTGDWISITTSTMPELSGGTYVVRRLTTTTYELYDVYGRTVRSNAFSPYAGGGTAARIYTLTTPWNEEDLKYLKVSQDANVMNLTCVNQESGVEYAPQQLTRVTDASWTLTEFDPGAGIAPPTRGSAIASSSGSVNYSYVVTAVDTITGSESSASPIFAANNAVDMTVTAGSVVVSWDAAVGQMYYNVYRAPPGYGAPTPAGALYGFVGSARGNRLVDRNTVADAVQVPPTHKNPFARGRIIAIDVVSSSTNWTNATATIVSATGTGAILEVVIDTTLTPASGSFTQTAGPIVAVIIKNAGKGYLTGDYVLFSGDGSAATANVTVGASSGTYPGTSSYFQQRFALAYTLNTPNTYFMSQPGAPKNFDTRTPSIASDAITGDPWSLQVNGIQWMVQVAGGLLVMTGVGAWVLAGVGSFATNVQPISPSTQDAVPQAFVGVSATVVPIKINYDVLFVEPKGSLFYDQPYQLYALSEPLDLTENSTHLFRDFTIRDNAWCEQPNKLLWATRSDGVLLSLTWLKAQEVKGWARHDTNGFFWSVCSVIEPPVDALYLATERYPPIGKTYFIERMDNRDWPSAEVCCCVDCGRSLAQPAPAAELFISSPVGLGAVSGYTDLVGGTGWSSATVVTVVDDGGLGPGSGAVYTPVITAGVITALTKVSGGTGYLFPAFVFYDPENLGHDASAVAILDNSMTLTVLTPVFAAGDVGKVVRAGGGIMRITEYLTPLSVTANILSPVVSLIPNSGGVAAPAASGSWTMTAPVTRVGGLRHLAGMTVTGLADGNVVTPRVVDADGFVLLDRPASAVTLGLGFTPQLQSIYLDAGEPTVQGQRKKIAAATLRLEASRDVETGANQPDGSTFCPPQLAPAWGSGGSMTHVQNKGKRPYNALCDPLFTGDTRVMMPGGFDTKGQVAVQQRNPLPLQVLAVVNEVTQGDLPETKASPKRQSRDNG